VAWNPFRNIGLQLAALGLSVLLWMTISGQQVERNLSVQLQFRNMPATLELIGDALRNVEVRVAGASGLISALEASQIVATVDLTDARAGVRVFPLTTEQISAPLGVEIKSVAPSSIPLTLERGALAQASVKPTIDGEPAAGYEIGEVTWQPQKVEVVGPESRLQEVPEAVTERISIEGATSTVVDTVGVGMTDPALHLRQAQSARVTINIVPGPVAKFQNRPVMFQNLVLGRKATAQPAAVTVSVRAAQRVLSALADPLLRPYVDVTGLAAGRYNLPVRVDPQGGAYVVTAIEPATVAVRIQ
jgi:YbbR domain-containing protein